MEDRPLIGNPAFPSVTAFARLSQWLTPCASRNPARAGTGDQDKWPRQKPYPSVLSPNGSLLYPTQAPPTADSHFVKSQLNLSKSSGTW